MKRAALNLPIMPFFRFLGVIGTFTLYIPLCSAQTTSIASVDGRRLPLGVDTLRVYLIRGTDTTETGRIIDALAVRERGGRQLLHRVYQSRDQVLPSGVDSLTDELVTLMPVSHRSRRSSGSQLLEYAAGRVNGIVRTPDGDSTVLNTSLPATVFNSASFDLVIRAAPLAYGWAASVPAFLPGGRSVVELKARVAGVETIHGVRCWRVEADFNGMPVTFWIAQQDRKLRQQLMRIRPDISILFAR